MTCSDGCENVGVEFWEFTKCGGVDIENSRYITIELSRIQKDDNMTELLPPLVLV